MGLGVIAKLISEKGVGFIKPCDEGGDVFFHYSALVGIPFEQLTEGQAVSFDIDRVAGTRNRRRAEKVEPCDPKLLGRTSEGEPLAARHPKARRRKPTWRDK